MLKKLSGAKDEVKWQSTLYSPQLPCPKLNGLTWSKEDNGSEASKLFICNVQLSERFDQLLLDSESHSGHFYLCTSQRYHKVVSCSRHIQ